MKSNILILIVLSLVVSACSSDKRQRLSLAKRNLGRSSLQAQEKMSFAHEKGCLNLEALIKFYKRDASQAGRITVRDITTGSEEDDKNILPALIKERPLELELTSVTDLDLYFPLKIVKQTECESVEMVDANGKTQTFRIEKNREIKNKKEKTDAEIQVEERRRSKRAQPNPKARKKLPPEVQKASLKEYFPDNLLLVGDNGEKWSYKLDIQTKNLTVTSYNTIETLENCPQVKNLRFKEVYDVSLVTEKAEGIRVSANVLTALSDLGLLVPENVDKSVVKPKAKQQKEPAKKVVKPAPNQHARSLTSDQYTYLAKQLLSDSVKAPACD